MRVIAGEWKGRRLHAPKGKSVRPTTDRVREAWMSALGVRVRDAWVWDLFAGSGALGLEALSRGAAHVTFVERTRGAIRALERNIEELGAADRCSVVHGDVYAFLKRESGPVTLAFADPPYGVGDVERLVSLYREAPFANELWVEHPSREPVPDGDRTRTRRYGDSSLTTLTAPSDE